MKAYKGLDQNLKCRNFQFEVGKEYQENEANICECGFHACEYPLDVFSYYPPADSRYCKVDLDANEQKKGDSKRVGKHIKIFAEIGLPGLIKAGVEYIKDSPQRRTPETSPQRLLLERRVLLLLQDTIAEQRELLDVFWYWQNGKRYMENIIL